MKNVVVGLVLLGTLSSSGCASSQPVTRAQLEHCPSLGKYLECVEEDKPKPSKVKRTKYFAPDDPIYSEPSRRSIVCQSTTDRFGTTTVCF